MENVLPLVESSTQAKTNILLTLIMPKPISIFHECKVIVIIICICVFIHKINKVSFNISYSLLKGFPFRSTLILNPTILLFCYLIEAISSFKSLITLVRSSSCWEKACIWKVFFAFSGRLEIFRNLWLCKNLLVAIKIYTHTSFFQTIQGFSLNCSQALHQSQWLS